MSRNLTRTAFIRCRYEPLRGIALYYFPITASDAAVTATGNGVTLDGISFSISNQSALLGAARAQAMQAANTEATQVAAGGGLTLGPIVSITDQENAGQYVYYSQLNTAAPVAGTAVPVQPGQQQISVQVTVVYQLVASS